MVRSQATTMKIRNKNGRIHGALSAFDTPPGPFGSATLRSLAFSFRAQINPLDKYCLVVLLRQNLRVVPANAIGCCGRGQRQAMAPPPFLPPLPALRVE